MKNTIWVSGNKAKISFCKADLFRDRLVDEVFQ